MHAFTAAALVTLLMAPSASLAQLLSAGEGPIVYGHHHLNASNVAEHKRFWIDGLGGVLSTNTSWFPGTVIKFPNVLIMLNDKAPKAGMKGTSVDHIGFQVPNLPPVIDRLRGMGYQMITKEELGPQHKVTHDIAFVKDQNANVAFVMGPDQIKVEIAENKRLPRAIALLNVQLSSPDVAAMQAWYAKVFGAKPGKSGGLEADSLPGVTLTFVKADGPVSPTAGTAFDHLGFEIKNLKGFVDTLESRGAKANRPYAEFGPEKLGFSFVTDPWGTNIEINEGLARIFQ